MCLHNTASHIKIDTDLQHNWIHKVRGALGGFFVCEYCHTWKNSDDFFSEFLILHSRCDSKEINKVGHMTRKLKGEGSLECAVACCALVESMVHVSSSQEKIEYENKNASTVSKTIY